MLEERELFPSEQLCGMEQGQDPASPLRLQDLSCCMDYGVLHP